MAAVSKPTKFIQEPNAHLLCPVCSNLFKEPVINVTCGHTFCRQCVCQRAAADKINCPLDSQPCDIKALVCNKALQSQIEDLEVYCGYGLIWNEDTAEFVTDSTGCSTRLRYGDKISHEEACEYIPVVCPNGKSKCGKLRSKDMKSHLENCSNVTCPHLDKGCLFTGTAWAVEKHVGTCGFRGLQSLSTISTTDVTQLKSENKQLKQKIDKLTSRLSNLENEQVSHKEQVNQCLSAMQQLQLTCRVMQEQLDRGAGVKRSSSNVESRHRHHSGSGISRSPSFQGGSGSYNKPESWIMPFQFKCIGTLRSHSSAVRFTQTRRNLLYSCGDDCQIKVWDLEALAKGCKFSMEGHTDRIQTIAIGEHHLYSGGDDLSLRMWSLDDHTMVKVIENAHDDVIAALICSEDHLFSSSLQVVKVWEVETMRPLHSISGRYHWVRSLCFNPTKDLLYSGSHNTVEIWDLSGNFNLNGKISHTYGSAYSLAVTSIYIIVGTYNQNIHLFESKCLKYVQKLSGHVGTVMSMVASPSGRFLFTASSDATIQVWSLENLLPIQSLARHEDSVNSLAIHGDLLLSASEDKEIKVFKYFKMQMGFVPT